MNANKEHAQIVAVLREAGVRKKVAKEIADACGPAATGDKDAAAMIRSHAVRLREAATLTGRYGRPTAKKKSAHAGPRARKNAASATKRPTADKRRAARP